MRLKTKSTILSVLFMIAGLCHLPAQNPFISNYTSFNGLPSNNVYQVYQDSKKFIWFATDAGVARYDGTQFIYFSKKNGLSCNDVVRIKEDSTGRVWFFNMDATLNFYLDGVIYNGSNAPCLDSLKSLELFRDFHEDADHTIYFYRNHQRDIFVLDAKNQVQRHKLPSILLSVPGLDRTIEGIDIRHLKRASDGLLYMFTISGLYRFDSFPDNFVLIPNSLNYKAVFTDANKNTFIWIMGSGEHKYDICRLKDDFNIDPLTKPIGTNSEFVSSVFEDNSGCIWISTFDMGVYCYQGDVLLRHFDILEAQTIIQDHENNIWFSSLKDGVFKISPLLNQHFHYEPGNFEGKGILDIANHKKNGIWLTNGNKIYLLQDNKFLRLAFQNQQSNFNQLLQVDDRTLLAGALSTPHYSIEGIRPDLSSEMIQYSNVIISPRPCKILTTNTSGDEITSWNFFTVFRMKPRLFEDVTYLELGERVYNAFYNSDGEVVVNARKILKIVNDSLVPDAELAAFNSRIIADHLVIDSSVDVFNIEGDSIFILCDDQLYNLSAAWNNPVDLQIKFMEYKSPTLVIGTSRNLFYCDNPLNVVSGDPVELKMMDISFRNIHDILFDQHRIYVASDDGLTLISGESLSHRDEISPIPYFRDVLVNDESVLDNRYSIVLTGRNKILLDFSSINYSFSPVIYSYKLEGLDKDWREVTDANVVYESLQKGDFTFKLRARKPTSDWSEPIEYRIRINATIWQHPVFYAILFLLLAGIVIILILWRKNVEIKRRDIEHQLVLLEQRALQAMMNPHFIFNSLGSIQNYLLQSKPGEATLYLAQFARLIRQNLNASSAAMISLEEEADRLKNYLELEKMRMEKKFDYRIEFDGSIRPGEILIPSMIIQPFVENSIWHGFSKSAGKGMIGISFHKQDAKSIKIIVEDNGIGMKTAEGNLTEKGGKHMKMGMSMTRKRLELLGRKHGVETGIVISETYPGNPSPGTHLEIIVPFAQISMKRNQF